MKNKSYKILSLCFLMCLPMTVMAQQDVVRGFCTPDLIEAQETAAARSQVMRRLPAINNKWDSTKTYRQLVILFSFSDTDFSSKRTNPREDYNRIFNETGYNEGHGKGCLAEYFRDQSNGMFNLQFDVYGPYKVSGAAQPYASPTDATKNYGRDNMIEATNMFLQENPSIDFSPYDWNNNGTVNQVIFVYAGIGGNEGNQANYGHIWPNTSSFSAITTPDGKKISNYSASAELWRSGRSCGIGTICHEYSHSLGLPDMYPTKNVGTTSILDEWELMDGGNFTNDGWCPANYTAFEKYLMGWLSFTELTEPATIVDLKPVTDGGKAYVIKHTENEYLLLENRQWTGWDKGIPGNGLVVYHVNYDASAWSGNAVNNVKGMPKFCLIKNDELSYEGWTDYLISIGVTKKKDLYQNADYMNSKIFSNDCFPQPGETEGETRDSLTDLSVPALVMYNNNASESKLLSKPITHIKVSEEGQVSFDFMGGHIPTAISMVKEGAANNVTMVFDLNGRRMRQDVAGQKGMRLVRLSDGTVRKLFFK